MTTSQLDISGTEDDHDLAIDMFDAILAISLSDSGAVPMWLSASQEVVKAGKKSHAQIRTLQSKLRKYGEGRSDADDWAKIADFGMTGFMGGYEIPMLDAIMKLKNSNGAKADKADVKQKAAEFFQYIKKSDLIKWLDHTPPEIGFQTTIQADLGGALSALIKKI